MRQPLQPLRPPTAAITLGGQAGEHAAVVDKRRHVRVELGDLLAQGAQLQEHPGAVRLLQAAQRLQALGQLGASGKRGGIILLQQNLVGGLHQGLGAVDFLQRGQAQAGQAQQMLGFSQTPVLTAGIQHIIQTLAEALLITLDAGQQLPTLFQLLRRGQLRQLCAETLLALHQGLRLAAGLLQHLALLLALQVQGTHLPDTPPRQTDTGSCQHQSQRGQTTTTGCRGGRRRALHWGDLHFILRGGCFAHVSILCIRGPAAG